MQNSITAVSLKMYFDRDRTLSYCSALKDLVSKNPGLTDKVRLAVLPDFLTILEAGKIFEGSGVELGAQDLAFEDRGAFTGEVSGFDLAKLGVKLSRSVTPNVERSFVKMTTWLPRKSLQRLVTR